MNVVHLAWLGAFDHVLGASGVKYGECPKYSEWGRAIPKSQAFVRIKYDILQIVRAIPKGQVTTYKAISAHLDVMSRHVAYILTMLSDEEKLALPWYRVVGDKGKLGSPKKDGFGRFQADLLVNEGIEISRGKVVDLESIFLPVGDLNCGVPQKTRPLNPLGKRT